MCKNLFDSIANQGNKQNISKAIQIVKSKGLNPKNNAELSKALQMVAAKMPDEQSIPMLVSLHPHKEYFDYCNELQSKSKTSKDCGCGNSHDTGTPAPTPAASETSASTMNFKNALPAIALVGVIVLAGLAFVKSS